MAWCERDGLIGLPGGIYRNGVERVEDVSQQLRLSSPFGFRRSPLRFGVGIGATTRQHFSVDQGELCCISIRVAQAVFGSARACPRWYSLLLRGVGQDRQTVEGAVVGNGLGQGGDIVNPWEAERQSSQVRLNHDRGIVYLIFDHTDRIRLSALPERGGERGP